MFLFTLPSNCSNKEVFFFSIANGEVGSNSWTVSIVWKVIIEVLIASVEGDSFEVPLYRALIASTSAISSISFKVCFS